MKRFAIATAVLALSACGSGDTTTIETPDGTVEYSTKQNGGNSTVTVSSEGEEVTIASGPGQKVTLPDGFSIYPNATVIDSSTVTHANGSGVRVMMSTDASPLQVADFYRKQAKAAGIAVTETTGGGQVLLGGKAEDGTDFTVTASGGEGATSVNLFIAKGF